MVGTRQRGRRARTGEMPASTKRVVVSETSTSEEEYEVERVVDKRKRRGRVQYLVKWVGYDESENTWQDEETMNCPDLIARFEAAKENVKDSTRHSARLVPISPSKRTSREEEEEEEESEEEAGEEEEEEQRKGTEDMSDWEGDVENVTTVVRDKRGNLVICLRWKNGTVTQEPASIANKRCPQKIIRFYESRLRFPE